MEANPAQTSFVHQRPLPAHLPDHEWYPCVGFSTPSLRPEELRGPTQFQTPQGQILSPQPERLMDWAPQRLFQPDTWRNATPQMGMGHCPPVIMDYPTQAPSMSHRCARLFSPPYGTPSLPMSTPSCAFPDSPGFEGVPPRRTSAYGPQLPVFAAGEDQVQILTFKEIKELTDKIGTKRDWTLNPHSLRLWSLRVQDALDLLGKTPPPRQMVAILRATLPKATSDRLRALGDQGPQDTTALFEYLDVQVEGMKNSDIDKHEARIASAEQKHRSHADWVSYLEKLRAIDMSLGIRRMPDFWSRILINRLAVRSDIQLGLTLTRGRLNDFDFVRDQVLRLDCGLKEGTADNSDKMGDEDMADLRVQKLKYDSSADESKSEDNDEHLSSEVDLGKANFLTQRRPKAKALRKKAVSPWRPGSKGFLPNKRSPPLSDLTPGDSKPKHSMSHDRLNALMTALMDNFDNLKVRELVADLEEAASNIGLTLK